MRAAHPLAGGSLYRLTALISCLLLLCFTSLAEAAAKKTSDGPDKSAKASAGDGGAAITAMGSEYIIGIDDVLEISVWKSPDLTRHVTVRPDGMITLPLVGDIMASGRTPTQLKSVLTERLKEYQETVIASVIVSEVRSYRIYVLGEVLNPGTYTVTRKTSILQAIALAGGFSPFASRNRIVIVRESASGRAEKMNISFDRIVDADELKDGNVILNPGDTVFVP